MTGHYEQRKASNERYLATQNRIVIRVPKEDGLKETIATHADSRSESMQAFILRAILCQMERDREEDAGHD